MNKKSIIAILAAAACAAGTGSAVAQPIGGASDSKGTTPKKCKIMNPTGTKSITIKAGTKSTTVWPDGEKTNWYCRESGTRCYYHYDKNGNRTATHCSSARVAPEPTRPAASAPGASVAVD